jgi:hypothetical protein
VQRDIHSITPTTAAPHCHAKPESRRLLILAAFYARKSYSGWYLEASS